MQASVRHQALDTDLESFLRILPGPASSKNNTTLQNHYTKDIEIISCINAVADWMKILKREILEKLKNSYKTEEQSMAMK